MHLPIERLAGVTETQQENDLRVFTIYMLQNVEYSMYNTTNDGSHRPRPFCGRRFKRGKKRSVLYLLLK